MIYLDLKEESFISRNCNILNLKEEHSVLFFVDVPKVIYFTDLGIQYKRTGLIFFLCVL